MTHPKYTAEIKITEHLRQTVDNTKYETKVTGVHEDNRLAHITVTADSLIDLHERCVAVLNATGV